ncbi:MAG: hypothetical protein E4H27_00070 [Anaerolineales bacterium]|nr:MAG: hypothetical protein E4H27_00070 [Anaerolineales bacterium]
MRELGVEAAGCEQALSTVKLLLNNHVAEDANANLSAVVIIRYVLSNPDLRAYIKLNRYQDVLWFNKEAFEALLWWVMLIAVIEIEPGDYDTTALNQLPVFALIGQLAEAEELSEFRVDKLLAAL